MVVCLKRYNFASDFAYAGNDDYARSETIAPKKGYFSLGISIYSYSDEIWEAYGDRYKATDFDKATGWSKFLDMNTVGVKEGDTNPSNNSTWELGYLED